jgi:hypothetical protein
MLWSYGSGLRCTCLWTETAALGCQPDRYLFKPRSVVAVASHQDGTEGMQKQGVRNGSAVCEEIAWNNYCTTFLRFSFFVFRKRPPFPLALLIAC